MVGKEQDANYSMLQHKHTHTHTHDKSNQTEGVNLSPPKPDQKERAAKERLTHRSRD